MKFLKKIIINFNKSIFILVVLIFVTTKIKAQGLEFITSDKLNEIDKYENQDLGFADLIPFRYSLEKYVPPVLEQKGGTCVGFAMGYYGISTMHNYYFNRTSFYEKVIHSFDPQYAYTINSHDCAEGLNMLDAFRKFATYGAKKRFFKPIDISCEENPITTDQINDISNFLVPYRLEKFEFINTNYFGFIEDVKINIAKNYPVMIGTNLTESFNDVRGSESKSAIWSPKGDEQSIGGHAMCVIGYDDTYNGGSFRIVNSWGKDWGDNGFFWISYDDFKERVSEAYVFKPYMIDPENKEEQIDYFDDYSAFFYNNKLSSYEGEVSESVSANGYGIVTVKGENNYGVVGKFINGERDGKHFYISNEGYFIVEYDMGEYVSSEELGFAGNNDPLDKEINRYGSRFKSLNLNKKQLDSIIKMGGKVGKWEPPKKE